MARILIIDDDELARIHLSTILRNAGHTVHDADSGQKCLEQITHYPIDIIITDIFMPTMDGFELLATILNRYPESKVIAMSGGGASMNRKLTLHAAKILGAMALIEKPFQMNDILKKVSRVLETQPTHRLFPPTAGLGATPCRVF